MLLVSQRAASVSVSFSYTSLGFCKQAKHIGVLNMLRPILNYIFECNLRRYSNLSSAFEKADRQWEQILKPPRNLAVIPGQVLFPQYVLTLTAKKKRIKISHQRTLFKF